MTAFLLACWRGEVGGPALWLTVAGAGLLLGTLLAVALCLLADWVFRTWPEEADELPPVPMHRDLEELPELTDKARDSRARFTSLIFVLGLLAVPVIALTR